MKALESEKFGKLFFHLGPNKDNEIFINIKKNKSSLDQCDYILCTGDSAIIGLSSAIVSDNTNGCFNLLKWDKRERKYYPLRIDIHDKGGRNE